MLDINLDGLAEMNTVAGWFLGSAMILLVIGGAVGLLLWASGKAKAKANLSEKGMGTFLVAAAGAVVLGSIGGAVSFGSSLGTENLMPAEAGQQDVVVERNAPTTTCTDQAVRDFNDEDDQISVDQREDVLHSVAGDELFGEFDLGARDSTTGMVGPGTGMISSVKWYPQGPNCSAENLTAASGTDIEVVMQGGTGAQTVTVPDESSASIR